jgi:CubicO group peptidase (beta-lactamase class C family)
MTKLQFRVLYREFLFRMVDLELLSGHALGDSNKLLGRFASLMIFFSIFLASPALGAGGSSQGGQVFLPFAFEHFLISTTMVVVGLFAVLSWDSTFPDRRDVLVLAPLPVRPRTFFLAKVAAVSVALGMTILTLNGLPGLLWPLALGSASPPVTAPALTWDKALPPAGAAEIKAIMDRDLLQPLAVGAMAPGTGAGLVIGVSQHGTRSILAYGAAKEDSIFELGSISKTFTGLMLARMIEQGTVRLDEPVRDLLPPDTVGKPPGAEITLLDLVTHHSGLPGMPANLNINGQPNPGADYHAGDLYAYLKRHGVAKLPDIAFSYSNLGFGLLGQALADRAGTTYRDLLRQEITAPLGMPDTAVSLAPELEGRLIQAYDRHHQPIAAWNLDALAGAGAVRSTAGDMLTWLEANLHPEKLPADLAAAIRNSHVVRANVAAGMRIAFAWIQDESDGAYWHNGLISGYTSYAFFRPQRDDAGIVLFNNLPEAVSFSDLVGRHIRQRLAGEPATSLASVTVPANSGVVSRIRWFGVYWITMAGAGLFIFCCVLGLQGVAAQVLPRRWFLRASSFFQLAAFGTIVAVYFTQPIMATPESLMNAQGTGLLSWSPSYWFLGLMQQLHGSPALAPLARRAWVGLAIAVSVTAVAYALSYFRTLRKIVEEPDIMPGARGFTWLPRFGNAPQTAIVQFSIRTLLRSRQHRVILAFYLSIGFAMTIFLLNSPAVTERILETIVVDPWHEVSIPILASTLIMTIASVVGTRVLFSIPLDLRANWVFRIASRLDGAEYLAAARRSLLALSMVPLWLGSALLCFSLLPWRQAAVHVAALGLFGVILADACTYAFRKIPFTCSYLPGKSQVHMVILGAFGLLYFSLFAVRYERDILATPSGQATLLAILLAAALFMRWRSVAEAKFEPFWVRFEDAPADEILVLGLTQGRS